MSQVSDVFQGQVYFVESLNLFHTIDYKAQARMDDWVVVKRISNVEIWIEAFCNQPYIGVVRALESYQRQPGGFAPIASR